MKTKYLTIVSSLLLLALTGGIASAESSNSETKEELSPAIMKVLCENFPLNSRCSGATAQGDATSATEEEAPSTGAETPGAETPGAETPGAETPGAETPGAETPGAETPGAETPGAETPGVETPGVETPGVETPGAETPGAETPGAETPGAETPGVETPGAETPGAETPETPGTETPGAETPGAETPSDSSAAEGTIVEVASANESFKTLVAAIKAADLAETLSGEGPFTVFAPSDEAFAALPSGTVEALLKPENKEKLVKVLKYHVVPAKTASSELQSGDVPTVAGDPVKVTVENGAVTVNNASVVQADVMGSNGVIHVIDKVLLPPNL